MGKTKDYQQTFLDTVGRQLGYDEENLPEFDDIEFVMSLRVPVWEYKGKTKEEYYKGDDK